MNPPEWRHWETFVRAFGSQDCLKHRKGFLPQQISFSVSYVPLSRLRVRSKDDVRFIGIQWSPITIEHIDAAFYSAWPYSSASPSTWQFILSPAAQPAVTANDIIIV